MLDAFGPSPILLPVLALVLWSVIQLLWMVITRLPAISAAELSPEAGQRTSELGDQLPKGVQWKADNYNHLMEQPTIFYATAIVLAIAGLGTGLNLYMAWFYTGSRVVHSIVHSTTNSVMVRFMLFLLGTVAIVVMAVNGLIQMV
jgi:hypothetical protein